MFGTTALGRVGDTSTDWATADVGWEWSHLWRRANFGTSEFAYGPLSASPSTGDSGASQALAYASLFLYCARRFHQVVADARGYVFHDGMSSPLSEVVHDLIRRHRTPAVDALKDVLRSCDGADVGAAEEIARQVGLLDDEATHSARLNLLDAMLSSEHGCIRDSALLGLSFLDDPNALGSLRRALERETEDWLVENLTQVIEQLEQTQCPSI